MNEQIKFILDNPHFSYETLNLKKKLTKLEKITQQKQKEAEDAERTLENFKETGQVNKNNCLSVLEPSILVALYLTLCCAILTIICGLFFIGQLAIIFGITTIILFYFTTILESTANDDWRDF